MFFSLSFDAHAIGVSMAVFNPSVGIRSILDPTVISHLLLFWGHQGVCLYIVDKCGASRHGFHAHSTTVVPVDGDVGALRLFNASQRGEPGWITFIQRSINVPALETGISFLEVVLSWRIAVKRVQAAVDSNVF